MNDTIDGTPPPSYTTETGHPSYIFVVGFLSMFFLLIALIYTSYAYKRSRSPTNHYINDAAGNHVRFSRGIDDHVLVAFPTFLYSDAMNKTNTGENCASDAKAACGCSICLADYKAVDVVRLLPECGHLFHVKCIDTWLKAHPTCPVCRNSALARSVQLTDSMERTTD